MGKNLNEVNPKLLPGDRVILIYMQGEEARDDLEPGSTKGKVIKLVNQPKFRPTDPGYGYYVEWYDDEGKVVSKLPLFPESDGWIYDREYYESNPENVNEGMFENMDDLIEWGKFLQLFNKKELDRVCEMFELERRSGFFNMAMEGGRFLITGPSYIKDYIKIKSYEREFDEMDEEIHEAIISRSQEVRDIFIRNAMKYLENNNRDLETNQIQRTMLRLANTAKKYWMKNADKYINNEIL